jgi:hypothetical protein
MAEVSSAAGTPSSRNVLTPRVVAIAVVAVAIVAAIVVVVVLKLQSAPALDLTGKWVAQQGPATVDLTLSGTSTNLSGTFVAKNAPIPISGTVSAHVNGTKADVTLNALGSLHTGTCTVSNTKLSCIGTGSDTSTLTLTFTRP